MLAAATKRRMVGRSEKAMKINTSRERIFAPRMFLFLSRISLKRLRVTR